MESMQELCHRCHGELPVRNTGGERGAPSRVEDVLLFCPHCSAPQILLPAHMRTDDDSAPVTTGAVPPPRPASLDPRHIDWRVAISSGALVAVIGAVLTVVGMKLGAVSVLSTFWIMGSSVLAMGLYTRRLPKALVDAKTGLRIGLVTGLMLVAALGVTLAATGVVVRFGLHGMGGLDVVVSQQFDAMLKQMATQMHDQNQDPVFQQRVLAFMGSQEVRGGLALFDVGFMGFVIVLLSAGGGAFSGMMSSTRTTRPGLRQGE
jgi:hypothetical protein